MKSTLISPVDTGAAAPAGAPRAPAPDAPTVSPTGRPRRLARSLLAGGIALLVGACAGGPPAPDWQANAHAALAGYRAAHLAGNNRLADAEFARARGELARTGRADQVARAELTRCALRTASLDFDDCPGFAALAADAGGEEAAYADFLAGRSADPQRLPAHYRELAGSGATALARIEEPLPRLIAAGVLLRSGKLPAAGVDLAVDTASAQGWRRPLLAWLEAQARLAEARGDRAAAELARRRIALVGGER